ncbi:MAG: RNA polymerase sigma factor [Proteobacteria bacterium]|nr:RNA polymerase sigma factor [Pseudomonadota bacterium]
MKRRRRIEPYLSRLFGYARSLTSQRADADDLFQESVLKALRAKRVPNEKAAYRAWLFRILRNTFIDQIRRTGGDRRKLDGEPPLEPAQVWHHDDTLINALTVRNGMARLAPPHREIIALVDIAGFSYSETAEFLELPVGTIMSRLSRARQALLHTVETSNVHVLPVARTRKVK